MRTRAFLLLFGLLLAFFAWSASPSVAAEERAGSFVGGLWLGSYNTFPSGDATYCIDSGRLYPRASYSWSSANDQAPNAAYILWKYGNTTDDTTAAAVSWIIHQSAELPHADVIPFGTPNAAIQNRINQLVSEMQDRRGPYQAEVVMPTGTVVHGDTYQSRFRLRQTATGASVADPSAQVTITIAGARFLDNTQTKSFALSAPVTFSWRPVSTSNHVTVTARVTYAPTSVRRWATSSVSGVQRVVTRQGSVQYSARGDVDIEAVQEDPATLVVPKVNSRTGAPLAGARIGLWQGTSATGNPLTSVLTDSAGNATFSNLLPNTSYVAVEMIAPEGFARSTQEIVVSTGAAGSTVTSPTTIQNTPLPFDLALRKWIVDVNGAPTGQTGAETTVAPTPVHVGDLVRHRLRIFNQNALPGMATNIVDYLPAGYDFVESANPNWTYNPAARVAAYDDLASTIIPADPTPGVINGDEPWVEVDLVLRVNSAMYTSTDPNRGRNYAEICQDQNAMFERDIDSSPDCDIANDVVGGDNLVDNVANDEDDHDYDEVAPQLTLATQATPSVPVGGVAVDTATISPATPGGLALTFRAYTDAQCQTTPVYTSAAIPTVEGTNSYTDPVGHRPVASGTLYWIAQVTGPGNQTWATGQCGDPTEITRVYGITTQARTHARVGQPLNDVALLSGEIPQGAQVQFRLYGPGDVQCTQAPVFVSPVLPVSGTTVTSPDYVPTAPGTYRWVESLLSASGQVLTSGACGAPTEISEVWDISTNAVPNATIGEAIYDIAEVVGTPPAGSSVVFRLYNGSTDATCTTPLFTSAPVPVNGAGSYQSGTFTPDSRGLYLWVEELLVSSGQRLAIGQCGAINESTSVTAPTPTTEPTPPTPKVFTKITPTG